MISQAVYSMLYANTNIQQTVLTKIYPNRAAQGDAMPYIVYSKVSKIPTDSKDNGTGFDKYRVQIDCFASTYTACEVLAGYVRTAMDRKKGSYGSMTVINTVFLDENDVSPFPHEDSDGVYQISVDFMIITK